MTTNLLKKENNETHFKFTRWFERDFKSEKCGATTKEITMKRISL